MRDNSRTLLMVFMSLLLVAFLIPNTIQGMSSAERQYKRRFGQAFGHQITEKDIDQARGDLAVLRYAGLAQLPEGAELQYYLLEREAAHAGVRVGRDEAKAYLLELSQRNPTWQQPDERLKAIQRSTRRSYEQIYDTIGRWLAIDRLGAFQATGWVDTLPRQALAYRDQYQEAVAPLSVVEDKAFLSQVPQPTDEQLQTFFDECKARKTAHTEKELVFGYLQPDRVHVEYLTVDPQKLKGEITVQAVQLRRYFEDHANRYTKPDPLATQPVAGQPIPQVPQTFEEARDRVREDCRDERAVELAQSLVNDVYNDARRPWAASPRGKDGFVETPGGAPPSFEELKQKYSTTHEVTYTSTGFMSLEQLKTAPGIGGAGLRIGQQMLRFPDLAVRVKGLLDKDPADGKPVLNVTEPAVVLTYAMDPRTREYTPRQAYLFRVTEIQPSAPPQEMGTMREEVVHDWMFVQAHELARKQADALAARARQVGLAAAVEQDTELKNLLTAAEQVTSQPVAAPLPTPGEYTNMLTPVTPQRLTRSATYIQQPKLGVVKDLPREIFALAEQPVSEADPHRAAVLPLASQYRWVVVELVEIKPLYEGAFEKELAATVQDEQSRSDDMRSFARLWGNQASVERRTDYVPEPTARPAPAEDPTAP
jgi:hypothetical protein